VTLDQRRQLRQALRLSQHRPPHQHVVPVLAVRQVALDGHRVPRSRIQWVVADQDAVRIDPFTSRPRWIEGEAHPGHARKPPFQLRVLRHPVLERRPQLLPRQLNRHHVVQHRQQREQILGQERPSRENRVGPQGSRVDDRHVRLGHQAHSVGHPVGAVGLLRPDVPKLRVQRSAQHAKHLLHRLRQLPTVPLHHLGSLRVLLVRLRHVLQRPLAGNPLPSSARSDRHTDVGEVAEISPGLDQRHAVDRVAVRVMVMPPEDQVQLWDLLCQPNIVGIPHVRQRYHHVHALSTQLRIQPPPRIHIVDIDHFVPADRRQRGQPFLLDQAHEADLHALVLDDHALDGVGHPCARLGVRHVGQHPREVRHRHHLLEVVHPKVEVVVPHAGRPDAHHVEKPDHVLALGDGAHDRRGQRVPREEDEPLGHRLQPLDEPRNAADRLLLPRLDLIDIVEVQNRQPLHPTGGGDRR